MTALCTQCRRYAVWGIVYTGCRVPRFACNYSLSYGAKLQRKRPLYECFLPIQIYPVWSSFKLEHIHRISLLYGTCAMYEITCHREWKLFLSPGDFSLPLPLPLHLPLAPIEASYSISLTIDHPQSICLTIGRSYSTCPTEVARDCRQMHSFSWAPTLVDCIFYRIVCWQQCCSAIPLESTIESYSNRGSINLTINSVVVNRALALSIHNW